MSKPTTTKRQAKGRAIKTANANVSANASRFADAYEPQHRASISGQDPLSSEDRPPAFAANKRKRASRSSTRREQIIATARELYEEAGPARTTVQDITSRVGVTRSLFYHYFPNKDAITSAVLDDMISDYVEALAFWNEERQEGKVDDALMSVVKLLRLGLFEQSPLHIALASDENAALYLDFVNRVAHHTATFIIETTVQDYAKLHEIRIQHLYETFYVLIIGVIGYLRTHPDTPDEVIADVIAQTLYLDRS